MNLAKHGLGCRIFGHSRRSKCLPLVERALIVFGDAERKSEFGVNARRIARALQVDEVTAKTVISELKSRHLIGPFADMSDSDLVWAMYESK